MMIDDRPASERTPLFILRCRACGSQCRAVGAWDAQIQQYRFNVVHWKHKDGCGALREAEANEGKMDGRWVDGTMDSAYRPEQEH